MTNTIARPNNRLASVSAGGAFLGTRDFDVEYIADARLAANLQEKGVMRQRVADAWHGLTAVGSIFVPDSSEPSERDLRFVVLLSGSLNSNRDLIRALGEALDKSKKESLSIEVENTLQAAVQSGDEWKAIPNEDSVNCARRLLSALEARNLRPHRIARAQDEGLGMTYVRHGRKAYIECRNDGTTWASLLGDSPIPKVLKLGKRASEFDAFVERVGTHLLPFTL